MPSRLVASSFHVFVLVVILVSAAQGAEAQAVGDTVRLRVSARQYVRGTFVRADPEALYLVPLAGGDTTRYAFNEFERSESLRGHHRGGGRALARSVASGAAVGLALGVAGGVFGKDNPRSLTPSKWSGLLFGPVMGALGGLLHGTVMAFMPQEDWQAFDLAPHAAR